MNQLLPFIKFLGLYALTLIAPIQGLLIIAGLAVFADTIFAVYYSVNAFGWSSFKSTKLFNIVVKTFFYFGTIIFAYFIDTHVVSDNTIMGVNLLISKLVTIFWTYIEVKSIDETSVKMGNPSLYNVIKKLLLNLKDLKKDINEIIK